MISFVIPVVFLWATYKAEDNYYPQNGTKSTLSALTLDWLADEEQTNRRRRELASTFETEPACLSTDCIGYARPASEKIARLMLVLLKNLEGDEGTIVKDLIQALIRTKLLVETSMSESELDSKSLVKTPGVKLGEPQTTFLKILAMTWMIVTDTDTTKKFGWCPINRVNKYLTVSKPLMISKQMKTLDPLVARARFIMEEFIQHVTSLNRQKKLPKIAKNITHRPKVRAVHVALAQSSTTPLCKSELLPIPYSDESSADSRSRLSNPPCFLIATTLLVSYLINMF